VKIANNDQDGPMITRPQADDVNYELSTAKQAGAAAPQAAFRLSQYTVSGTTQNAAIAKTDDFSEAGAQWRSYSKQQQDDLIEAMVADLNQVRDHCIKLRKVSYFYKADRDYGTQLAKATQLDANEVAALAGTEVSH
jgi:catalase